LAIVGQDLVTLLQDVEAFDASDGTFRPKNMLRTKVIVEYTGSTESLYREFYINNSHRLCMLFQAVGRNAKSLFYISDEHSKSLLKQKIYEFITSNMISTDGGEESIEHRAVDTNRSAFLDRTAALKKVYPTDPTTMSLVLNRIILFIKKYEDKRYFDVILQFIFSALIAYLID